MKKWIFLFALSFYYQSFSAQSINWLDFNKEIFKKAEQENKFVLLDLGASWCHWCHVMDDSTYNNKNVIDYLSKNFFCSREDQDKRPDLQSKYKEYGWPATIVFDKKGNEIFKNAGYVSSTEFIELLEKALNKSSEEQIVYDKKTEGKWTDSIQQFIYDDFYEFLDFDKGGFKMSQKYIDYDSYEYALLNYKKNKLFENWLKTTISNSAAINDKAWGGVYQYSTGRDWHYPHFEKLLSIQARYLKIYSKQYAAFKDVNSLWLAKEIIRYIDTYLKSNTELYYNSQDADLKEGEHGGEYFALYAKERLEKGIPHIDSSCYTKENAMIAEAFIYAWGATGEEAYLKKAEKNLIELRNNYKSTMGYLHDKKYSDAIALADNLYMCRALAVFYNASGKTWSLQEADEIGKQMIVNFKGKENNFLNYKSNSNPLPPNAVLAENIDACRLFNRLYYLTGENSYKQTAEQLFLYIISEEVLKNSIAESGILTLKAELDSEPTKVIVFLRSKNENAWEKMVSKLWRSNSDYFVIEKIIGDQVPEKYSEMKNAAGNNNCAFVCTANSCSSPFYKPIDLEQYIRNKQNK